MTSVRGRFLLLIIQDFMSLYIIIQGFTRTCFITCLYLEYYFWFRNQNHSSVLRRVVNLGSDTFGNPIFRRSYKICHPPDNQRPEMLCQAQPRFHEMPKLDFQSEFSMSKIIRIFLIFFSLKKISKNKSGVKNA